MTRRFSIGFCLILLLLLCWSVPGTMANDLPRHDLRVLLNPSQGSIQVEDSITLPAGFGAGEVFFELHEGLVVTDPGPNLVLSQAESLAGNENSSQVPTQRYRLGWDSLPEGKVVLRYGGKIQHSIEQEAGESARSFSFSPGLISADGVFLAGSSRWVPKLEPWAHLTFSLHVELPEAFEVVSQGRRSRNEKASGQRQVEWIEANPMEEVYLIAAPFHEYRRETGVVTALAFLRQPDPNLAARYLEATAQYIEMYSQLLGPYPYSKFALVENFWETGFGMPSFTLLGPTVIRLPFILHSSYPHEILHNWWGNSVYVDYATGNWCEGLTAYMADHLTKEGQNQGADYRRDTLKNYRNFASESRDFALRDFRSRHSPSTEAVGYGKSLMLWHMLRTRLGEARFTRGLQQLYRKHRYQAASFDDIQQVFSNASGENLAPLFDQWVNRVGAPELRLATADVTGSSDRYRLKIEVEQIQEAEPYRLRVPVSVTLEGEAEARMEFLELTGRRDSLEIEVSARPLLVEIDPDFDLFRKLDRTEIPPSLSQLFGSQFVTLVLPASGAEEEGAWRELAQSWKSPDGEFRIVREAEIDELPMDSSVWVLGRENRWKSAVEKELSGYLAGVQREVIRFGESGEMLEDRSFVFVTTHPGNSEEALAWIGSTRVDAIPGLARKLPHYGKYSFLAFAGAEPVNTVKGQWPTYSSPLVRRLGDSPGLKPGARPDREPLARLTPVFSPERITGHLAVLTSDEFQGRGLGTAGLDMAAEYIARQFREIGLEPAGDDGSFFQVWEEEDGPEGTIRLRNVVARLPGERQDWASQSVVLSAHYDHLGRGWPDVRESEQGKLHPGADDNASGVAVLLEVAQLLSQQLKPGRNLLFVAFSGEEWGLRGSRHFVRQARQWPTDQMMAAVNLDSVGRLEGREILVLGGGSASEWVHIARGIGFTTGISSKLVDEDFGSSDQRSFLEAGVPAVQIFAGAHSDYHRSTDTVDKIDLSGLVQVASFVRETIVYLSERDAPLTSNLGSSPVSASNLSTGRRASLGTVPDFAFSGPGVRVESVVADSAAAAAGIQAGDILVGLGGVKLADLRSYADALSALEPGDNVDVVLLRGGREVTLKATLGKR